SVQGQFMYQGLCMANCPAGFNAVQTATQGGQCQGSRPVLAHKTEFYEFSFAAASFAAAQQIAARATYAGRTGRLDRICQDCSCIHTMPLSSRVLSRTGQLAVMYTSATN